MSCFMKIAKYENKKEGGIGRISGQETNLTILLFRKDPYVVG